MRTIAWLKKELDKFPDEAQCYAYEGEVTGLIIEMPGDRLGQSGFIYCSEATTDSDGRESELLPTPPDGDTVKAGDDWDINPDNACNLQDGDCEACQ